MKAKLLRAGRSTVCLLALAAGVASLVEGADTAPPRPDFLPSDICTSTPG
jgi:hypothetical protein